MADLKVDSFSKDERAMIVTALGLMIQSVARKEKAEPNPRVAELRTQERVALEQIVLKFR